MKRDRIDESFEKLTFEQQFGPTPGYSRFMWDSYKNRDSDINDDKLTNYWDVATDADFVKKANPGLYNAYLEAIGVASPKDANAQPLSDFKKRQAIREMQHHLSNKRQKDAQTREAEWLERLEAGRRPDEEDEWDSDEEESDEQEVDWEAAANIIEQARENQQRNAWLARQNQ